MKSSSQKSPSIFSLLKPYRGMVFFLVALALLSNGLNLMIPKVISHSIDGYVKGDLDVPKITLEFLLIALAIFLFTYWQTVMQTYASERVARDLRQKLSTKISQKSYKEVQEVNPSKLLTLLTADIDSIKMFVSQAIVSLSSSLFILIGGSIMLLSINWKLASAVLLIIPIIGWTFFTVLRKVRALFVKTREVIDWLNKVINESILGSALIRVLNAQQEEYEKFLAANSHARDLGLQILKLFAGMIPIVTFVSNLAMLVILVLGGHFVISGSMSLGDFAAFNSYLALLIFPIFILGFVSNVLAQATASYGRIQGILNTPETPETGTLSTPLKGQLALKNVNLKYGEKEVLKNVSFTVKAKTKTAILGPTAAGKTQLLYLLTGLIQPDTGTVEYDDRNIADYKKDSFHKQVGFVFQDSIIFNLTLRENIAFNSEVTEKDLARALETAELSTFVNGLPQKLETMVSERGATLSGGQKQRVMLARALALNPKILLLDDFTARVDNQTEKKILENVQKNYPGITLVSITQKIASIEDYDQIILLMEGEVLAKGTHEELMHSCPEYVQIYKSQQSTDQL